MKQLRTDDAPLGQQTKLKDLRAYARQDPAWGDALSQALDERGQELLLLLAGDPDFTYDNVKRIERYMEIGTGDIFNAGPLKLNEVEIPESRIVAQNVTHDEALKIFADVEAKFKQQEDSGYDLVFIYDANAKQARLGMVAWADLERFKGNIHRVQVPRLVERQTVLSPDEIADKIERTGGKDHFAYWHEKPALAPDGKPRLDAEGKPMREVIYATYEYSESVDLLHVTNAVNDLWREGVLQPSKELVKSLNQKLQVGSDKSVDATLQTAVEDLSDPSKAEPAAKTTAAAAADAAKSKGLAAMAGPAMAAFTVFSTTVGAATGVLPQMIAVIGTGALVARPLLRVANALTTGHHRAVIDEVLGVAFDKPLRYLM